MRFHEIILADNKNDFFATISFSSLPEFMNCKLFGKTIPGATLGPEKCVPPQVSYIKKEGGTHLGLTPPNERFLKRAFFSSTFFDVGLVGMIHCFLAHVVHSACAAMADKQGQCQTCVLLWPGAFLGVQWLGYVSREGINNIFGQSLKAGSFLFMFPLMR